MIIRYFATTDDTAIGRVALEYLKGLLRIAPVRVLSLSGGLSGRWTLYEGTLLTPLSARLVNVVCSPPSQWIWTQRVPMPNVVAGQVVSTDTAAQEVELYTSGMRNVLLCVSSPKSAHPVGPWPDATPKQVAAARRYEALVVPTLELGAAWQSQGVRLHVIPLPVYDNPAFREIVIPPEL